MNFCRFLLRKLTLCLTYIDIIVGIKSANATNVYDVLNLERNSVLLLRFLGLTAAPTLGLWLQFTATTDVYAVGAAAK